MVMLATVAEMESKLGLAPGDLNQVEATRSIAAASARAETLTGYAWTPRTSTVTVTAPPGYALPIPVRPVRAVTGVSVAGVSVSDYHVTDGSLFASVGWVTSYLPQTVQFTVTYGAEDPPDDIKDWVLGMAIDGYDSPGGAVVMEAIDDYRVQYSSAGTAQAIVSRYGSGQAGTVAFTAGA